MKIKLEKNWRAFGQVNEAGTIMEIKDKKTIAYLKDNGYIKDKKNTVSLYSSNPFQPSLEAIGS